MSRISDWIENRTGLRSIIHGALYDSIPGGARWRYVWGRTVAFAFCVQLITGVFLWMHYSPSAQSAWESVYFVQYEVTGGWLLRGIHHYMAQIVFVLLVLHLLQVIVGGAYRAPREFNFWTGLILLQILIGIALTGYLLPWDQKGYWHGKIATNIAGITPVIGESVQRIVVGGEEYGHLTLTRFFALHAGVLPGLLIAVIGIHFYCIRRTGTHGRPTADGRSAPYWPDQFLRDSVACLAVLTVVVVLAVWHHAPLLAPAEPSEPYSAARPEWYFLFLYQFLKLFPGESEVWGAIYIPTMILGFMALMPVIGRWQLGHRFNILFVFALVVGAGGLTVQAVVEDSDKEEYAIAVAEAEKNAERVLELVRSPTGIPPEGAVTLLRRDPKTRGPELFARHCASCHLFEGHDGTGHAPEEKPSAADLAGFASRAWLEGFFDPEKILTPHYFGATALAEGKMVEFVTEDVAEYDDEEKEKLHKVILALSAEAGLRSQRELDWRARETIAVGRELMWRTTSDDEKGLNCTKCHLYYDEGRVGKAPDLTGYGSRAWLIDFISDPEHERFYPDDNDRMPRFGALDILDRPTIELIVDWMRGEWYVADYEPWEPPAETAEAEPEEAEEPTTEDVEDAEPASADE